jgi:hypothetical protein
LADSGEPIVLKLVSRFVLEVLPYVLSALIAAIVVPGFLSSQFHAIQPVRAMNDADQRVGAVELVRDDYAAFAGPTISDRSFSAVQRQPIAK